ncbi:MAG: MOSC domain-containing protein, partial [Nocardioidaceae bacterium]
MDARVLSVSVGRPVTGEWTGRQRRTGIDKRPVPGPVLARRQGLAGDHVVDTRFHGGPDKAVYAFAREDLDFWSDRLGVALPNGSFGENLTTTGLDLRDAVLGERWRVGSAVLSPSDVRTPCRVFAAWLGRHGVDTTGWARRFSAEGRAGTYLRVVVEGAVQAGDPVLVESRPGHGVTVATMFAALTTDRSLLPGLLAVEGLPPRVEAAARRAAAPRS